MGFDMTENYYESCYSAYPTIEHRNKAPMYKFQIWTAIHFEIFKQVSLAKIYQANGHKWGFNMTKNNIMNLVTQLILL